MLNRRHIRIKVMQSLYSLKGAEDANVVKEEKFLRKSLDNLFELYLYNLSLIQEVYKKSQELIVKSKAKLLPSQADINPNAKFVNNQALLKIVNNPKLNLTLEDRKLNPWYLDFDYVDLIHKAMIESDFYKEYMNSTNQSFEEDKQFLVDLFTKVIAPNEKLYDYFEDKCLTWIDDLPLVNTFILKKLNKLNTATEPNAFVPKLFRDQEDEAFSGDLLKKTLLNSSKLQDEVVAKTTNWDKERIAELDGVLLQMAVCEFQKFPSIPVKVTINEYLEIAKEYSTPKSSIFINGILDKIVKEYKANNNLNKTGRGLM